MSTTARRYLATAAHHEKAAKYLRQYGDEENAKKAEEAARICRQKAAKEDE